MNEDTSFFKLVTEWYTLPCSAYCWLGKNVSPVETDSRVRKLCTHSSTYIHSYDYKCFDILLEKAILALVWGTGCRWAMNPRGLTDDCSSVGSHSCKDDSNYRVLSTHCRLYLVFQRMGSSRTFQSRSCHQTMKRQAPGKKQYIQVNNIIKHLVKQFF